MSDNLYLVARVADQAVAIASALVSSVVELSEITPVPRAARHVLGLAALRSSVVTVIDTPVAIGLPHSCAAVREAVVVAVEGHDFALLVDAIEDAVALDVQPLGNVEGVAPTWAAVATGFATRDSVPILLVEPALILDVAAQPV